MMPILQIGPLSFPLPEILILLGVYLGLSLAEKNAKQFGITPDIIFNSAWLFIISGLIGGRLIYLLRYASAFSSNWGDLFSWNIGLFDPIGGVTTGILATAIYLQRKNLSGLSILDAATPAFAVLQLALALSHLASGEAYGAPTTLPWAIEMWGQSRHPSQVYEVVTATTILGILWPSKTHVFGAPPGLRTLRFLTISSASYLFLAAFRGESSYIFYGLRAEQVAAWLIMSTSMVLSTYIQLKSNHKSLTLTKESP